MLILRPFRQQRYTLSDLDTDSDTDRELHENTIIFDGISVEWAPLDQEP